MDAEVPNSLYTTHKLSSPEIQGNEIVALSRPGGKCSTESGEEKGEYWRFEEIEREREWGAFTLQWENRGKLRKER